MSVPAARDHAQELLENLAGRQATLRDDQWTAIEALVVARRRALVVQRTGWGKSAVYFIAAKMLRAQGRGPTVIVSPLLALMRNQVAAAQRAGVRAATINSGNVTEWDDIHRQVGAGDPNVLRVGPERLNNPECRDQVLPGEDSDAAAVLEKVFKRGGMTLLSKSRADKVENLGDRVVATLSDGRTVEGSHCLMAVGSVPNTGDIGLDTAGVQTTESGHIRVNRVARTSMPSIYAAGDCTTVMPLASVASMQGRTAVFHAMGDAVVPFEARNVTSNIFTQPEIATVGLTQRDLDEGRFRGDVLLLPLATNARAKMEGIADGFVKIICRRGTRIVAGAVIVAPHASELIHALTLAVEQRLTVDEVALTFTVYPSLSGSIAEAARRLHISGEEERPIG